MTLNTSVKKTTQLLVLVMLFCALTKPTLVNAQTISFGSSGLVGEFLLNPTSLEFGPDNRLYVSQQSGAILAQLPA